VNSHAVNARSFTLVGVLLAFRRRRVTTCGLTVAAAGLLSQYGVLAVPGVLYGRFASDSADSTERRSRWKLRWGVQFVGVAVGYASAFLVWGEAAFVASLDRNLWAMRRYVVEWTPSLRNGTETWVALHRRTALRLWHLLSLGAIGVLVTVRRGFGVGWKSGTPEQRALAFAASFSLPLFVRPFPTYWMYPLPWLTTLLAVGFFAVVRWFARSAPPMSVVGRSRLTHRPVRVGDACAPNASTHAGHTLGTTTRAPVRIR
jgi:hypothetical protein